MEEQWCRYWSVFQRCCEKKSLSSPLAGSKTRKREGAVGGFCGRVRKEVLVGRGARRRKEEKDKEAKQRQSMEGSRRSLPEAGK
jgi:N-acetylneuraminic acid mutarotase